MFVAWMHTGVMGSRGRKWASKVVERVHRDIDSRWGRGATEGTRMHRQMCRLAQMRMQMQMQMQM